MLRESIPTHYPDFFGRKVLEVEAPGTDVERGTVFIPNIGFGGGGEGADCAGEVTYRRPGKIGTEVLQYTYGMGAIGGGLGRKRVLEFVAYCEDHVPYHRFLHEDTQGNTIATTSLWGDRLDEYDYTDYGIPLHAPVALDGRWISSITSSGNVSTVTLSQPDLLSHNSVLGCELRLTKANPADAEHVFLTGTVISQGTSSFKIQDDGGAIATAWSQGGTSATDKGSCALYSLKQGFEHGVIENSFNTYWPNSGPWYNQPCTYIQVADAPFEASMVSSTLGYRYCKFVDDSNPQSPQWHSELIIGVDGYDFALTGYRQLVVLGWHDNTAYLDTGKWYWVEGTHTFNEEPRTGRWGADAIPGSGTSGAWFSGKRSAGHTLN